MPARPISSAGPAEATRPPSASSPNRRQGAVKVQQRVAGEGLTLVVFDCYRPVRAVDDFVDWTRQGGPPDPRWYPKVKRGDLIAEGYIGERSSHSRGSTVDLALGHIDVDAATSLPDPDCGAEKTGTLEFGTGFDCFDRAQLHSAFAAAGRRRRQPQETGRGHAGGRLPQLLARMVAFHAEERALQASSASTSPSPTGK